jgi:hypothetical protein
MRPADRVPEMSDGTGMLQAYRLPALFRICRKAVRQVVSGPTGRQTGSELANRQTDR